MTIPKWSTPSRQAVLVKLFVDSSGFCMYGFAPCKGYFETITKTVCAYGTPCTNPTGGKCKFKYLAEDTPVRDCRTVESQFNRWHCAYSPDIACYAPFDCHYELVANRLVKDWQAEDRLEASLDWQAERKALHSLGEARLPLRGRFSNIAKDIFHDKQPIYYLETMGISGLTLKPFARVKIGSSYIRLYVNLGDSLRGTSKNRRRKAIRYGKPLPMAVSDRIAELVKLAVRDYLK